MFFDIITDCLYAFPVILMVPSQLPMKSEQLGVCCCIHWPSHPICWPPHDTGRFNIQSAHQMHIDVTYEVLIDPLGYFEVKYKSILLIVPSSDCYKKLQDLLLLLPSCQQS